MSKQEDNQEEDPKNELWQRQIDVLKSLTEAEKQLYLAMGLQNPLHDLQYGKKRNLVSVSSMLNATETMLFIVSPLLKGEKGDGMDSEKYELYETILTSAQQLINQSMTIGINTPIGENKLAKAYVKIRSCAALLKQLD